MNEVIIKKKRFWRGDGSGQGRGVFRVNVNGEVKFL